MTAAFDDDADLEGWADLPAAVPEGAWFSVAGPVIRLCCARRRSRTAARPMGWVRVRCLPRLRRVCVIRRGWRLSLIMRCWGWWVRAGGWRRGRRRSPSVRWRSMPAVSARRTGGGCPRPGMPRLRCCGMIDPDAAEERRRDAATRARVGKFREDAGSGALSGRVLPPDAVHRAGLQPGCPEGDADHTVPWPDGPTCQANLGP